MIIAENLAFTPTGGARPIFAEVSLSILPGDRVGIVGPSGSGKTTLGYHLCGTHRLALSGTTTGRLVLGGRDGLDGGPPGFAGLVGQNPEAQLFCDTVMEEVTLGPRSNGQGQDACEREGEALLRRYGLESRRTASLGTLSLGQKQLVATLSMLAIRPKVLLLDEPTSYLDVATADRLFSHLEALCRAGDFVPLVIEHDMRRLAGFANRLVRIENGRLVYDGPPEACPGVCPGRLRLADLADETVPPDPRAEPALAFRDLGFGYPAKKDVFSGIDLAVRPGEIVVLRGHNGTGKSTLLRLAKGLARPTSGGVFLGPGLSAKRHVGLMTQNPDAQIFAHTVSAECGYWLANLGVPEPERNRRVGETLSGLGLGDKLDRSPFSLSFGEKRRLCLASVLVADPPVLCLDEPTTGLDLENVTAMAAVLRCRAASGAAILAATHDPEFADMIATRQVTLENGRMAG